MTFTERRLHPRIATDLEAEILSPADRSVLGARLLNVSIGGLRIGGASALRDHLTTESNTFPVQTDISFELPHGTVRLTCRHIHTLRLSADVFEFGFKILRYNGDAQQYLETFIARRVSES